MSGMNDVFFVLFVMAVILLFLRISMIESITFYLRQIIEEKQIFLKNKLLLFLMHSSLEKKCFYKY